MIDFLTLASSKAEALALVEHLGLDIHSLAGQFLVTAPRLLKTLQNAEALLCEASRRRGAEWTHDLEEAYKGSDSSLVV
ncbi:hypothetical protein CYMTET_53892 [Cymbomonas tetramitiformis]|uniref:Uncharacterized protein n=1 Tax=Cymbomonas tetramitiformis TaxID=36881 RepID=A0AAE0EPL9_9CHLO|nr:hypothetical protein CYMTET_53892 [Cymbomonas tetramitiformis]